MTTPTTPAPNMDALLDIPLRLSAELASSLKPASDLLRLKVGSVVEFDTPAKAPVDLYVNQTLMAYGEIVVQDEQLAIKVTKLVTRV